MDVKIAVDQIATNAAAAFDAAIAESVEADKIAKVASAKAAAAKATAEKAAAFRAISAEYVWVSDWSKSMDALFEGEKSGAFSMDQRLEAYRKTIAAGDKVVLFAIQTMIQKDGRIFDLEQEKAELKANFNKNKWTALESVLQKEMDNWPDQKAMKEELTKLRMKIKSLESKVKTLASLLVETFTLAADRARKLMEDQSLEEESSEEDE